MLPCGLSLAPRVFSKCVEAALSPLRSRGIRIFSYIDDYLLCSHSREQALRDVDTVTSHISGLNKLDQKPSAGRTMHLLSGAQYRLPQISCHTIGGEATVVQSVSGPAVQFRLCLRLLGLMVSVFSVVRLCLLLIRDMQTWVASLRLCPRRHLSRSVKVSAECSAALHQWRNPAVFLTGCQPEDGGVKG